MLYIETLLQDGFFAALASVGFASLSNPPRKAYPCCALLAAVGHALRYLLMNNQTITLHIIPASTIAALVIGFLAIQLALIAKCPAETCFFPALLPMIPGMYAYRTVEAIIFCLCHPAEQEFMHYLYLFAYNGFTCSMIMLGMVVGANIPIFLMKRLSFMATKMD
ncbi:MAG: threonine/serine exporter family protein [Bacteroides sp.]